MREITQQGWRTFVVGNGFAELWHAEQRNTADPVCGLYKHRPSINSNVASLSGESMSASPRVWHSEKSSCGVIAAAHVCINQAA